MPQTPIFQLKVCVKESIPFLIIFNQGGYNKGYIYWDMCWYNNEARLQYCKQIYWKPDVNSSSRTSFEGYVFYQSWESKMYLGLGPFLVEQSFFPKNKRNNQERFHCSENGLKRTVKIVNAFLLSRTCSKLGMHFKSGTCSKSSRNS